MSQAGWAKAKWGILGSESIFPYDQVSGRREQERLTIACRRPPIASARASLRLSAAPEAWRSSGAERRKNARDELRPPVVREALCALRTTGWSCVLP